MQLDDLKEQWNQEIKMQSTIPNFDSIKKRATKYDRKAQSSWMIEVAACLGCGSILVFGWFMEGDTNPILQIGFFWGLLTCIFIAVKIIRGRRTKVVGDWSLASTLDRQIEQRQKESNLLKTTYSWYLSPIFLAVILMSYGGDIEKTGSYIPSPKVWIYWGIVVVCYTGIYFYHQWEVKKQINPLIEQLREIKRQLQE